MPSPDPVPPPPLLEACELVRSFGGGRRWTGARRPLVRAVDGVSFSLASGQTLGIVGESGSGKSTVARMVVGLIEPSAGEIRLEGEPVRPRGGRSMHRWVQLVFQDPIASLNPRKTAQTIIEGPLRSLHPLPRGARAERARELLAMVGLRREHASRYPHEFSGGQCQRIAIARALAAEPRLLVLDEPVSALDVSIQAQILKILRDLQTRLGLTYLFISHNLAVVRHMATRIGVMYLGRIVEIAPTAELFENPRHPYARMLLDAVPDLAMTGRARKMVEGEIPNPIAPPPGCTFNPRCPAALDRCRQEVPLTAAHPPQSSHQVACHAVAEGRI
jgi:peptide/nickel transport system ATP-binding protein